MKRSRSLTLAVMVFFLNGCAMLGYKRPAMPTPAVFPSTDAYAKVELSPDARPVDQLRWQDVFPDAKLQKVIEMALVSNRDLRIAILNVESARGLYGIRAAEMLPSLSVTAAGTEQLTPAGLSSTGKAYVAKQYSVDLGVVAWEVDLFGRIRSLKQQALHEYLAVEQLRHGAQTALISEVARVYLTLAADLENLKLAKATLEAQQNTYRMIRQQYDTGIANEADLRRSQTQVDTATRDIAVYTQMVAQDQNALNLVAGVSVPEDLLPLDLASVAAPRDISQGVSSEVLLRRPDIMAAEHRLIAAHAFIDAARAAFFPQISLTSVVGTASNDLSGLFAAGTKKWTFAPQAAMAIFDARTFAAYRVSKAERKIALAKYEKTIQVAFREVSDALAVRGTVDQQVAAQASIVASAQKIYEISNQRYTQGIDGYLSVLDAQRSLYGAQQALTSMRLAKLLNQIRFYNVLGGDGEFKRPAMRPGKNAQSKDAVSLPEGDTVRTKAAVMTNSAQEPRKADQKTDPLVQEPEKSATGSIVQEPEPKRTAPTMNLVPRSTTISSSAEARAVKK